MTNYRVETDGTGKYNEGLVLGFVVRKPDGWRFIPHFQRLPSRKSHPTPEAAVKGRIKHYRLVEHTGGY